MGHVYRPRDIIKGRKRMLEQGLRDITPGAREEVLKVLHDWRGDPSMDRLIELMGNDKAKKLRELLDNK